MVCHATELLLFCFLCQTFGQRLNNVYKKTQGIRAQSTNVNLFHSPTLEDCLIHCELNSATCKSLNFKESDGTCEALPGHNEATSVDSDWVFLILQAKSSCADWKNKQLQSPSGTYIVDPDGPGGVTPFPVECDMATTPPTVRVNHNQITRKHIVGYEDPNFYEHQLVYNGVTNPQLRALATASSTCRQYVKKECYNACTFYYGTKCDFWTTLEGEQLEYWAGNGTTVTRGCACALSDTCALGEPCNCDANDNRWRTDEGYLTAKEHLPISAVMIGDTGKSVEQVYITVGPLECTP
ncbi:contactin-associated protein-like 2 [Lingula anatina]|uniref:Contactin-associated protein-like 2 n=1 Tax=Lingula anatina TaxID=7574 RepID=A0A2R2MSR5_LINAN|nr:contactin-associated protein-like 2 [Lingula anatina]|eukprot:XP_023933284.1 contactin-associated protein-like 2 [Lingula anatina]